MVKASVLMLVFCLGIITFTFAQNTEVQSEKHDSVFYSLETALKYPEQVYKLKLHNKKLAEIPQEIFNLKNLKVLDLSKNKIQEIPSAIAKLTQLEVLDLSKNKIETFNKEIGQLTNLKILRISRNNLVAIPAEIENLQKLEVLDLWDNDLVGFPDNISKLEMLKVFDLRGILIDAKIQKKIQDMLPNTKIHFSPSCNCGF